MSFGVLPVRLTRSVQSLQRLRRIARVLTQHGFGHIVDRLDLGRFVPLWLKKRAGVVTKDSQVPSVGRRLQRVANELGPIFVKLGQMLATRPDIIPPDILAELQTLQDRVAPFDSEVAMSIVSQELGTSLSESFRSVDDEPIASGSIGQVYRATLQDGRPVVIKVRRPNIGQEIRSDLQLLKWLAEGLERWVPEIRPYRPCTLAEEFERALLRELDFMHEAATTARLRDAFAATEHIEIPEVIWTHSTQRVLTLEALQGKSLLHALDENCTEYDRKLLASRLANMYLRQFFEIGTFHADPHPGNILVTPPAQIGLIDFGQFGVVSDALAGNLLILLLGAVHRDMDLIFDALGEMGAIGDDTNRGYLVSDLQTMVDKYHGQPIERLKISTMFNEMAETVRRHDVSIPRDAILMLKSLATVWGAALQLDPKLDMVRLLKPRLASMVRDRLSPMRALRTGGVTLWHLLGVLRSAPQQVREMLKQLSSGRWQVHIRHENLEALGRDLDRSSNRMAFAIVIAGVVVGSSALVSADPNFQVLGVRVQVLGVIGYLLAAVFGMGLLWAILRSGRLS